MYIYKVKFRLLQYLNIVWLSPALDLFSVIVCWNIFSFLWSLKWNDKICHLPRFYGKKKNCQKMFYWSTTRGLPCLAKSVHSLPVVAEQAAPYSPASHSSCLFHPAPQTRPAPPCISEHSGDGEPFSSCIYEGVALTYSVSCICRT